MDISGERETQMTESLISKVKELINKGNAEEALSLLQSQVEQGDGYAMYCLGRCYEEGWALNKMVKRPFCGMARRGKHLTQKRLKEK